LKFGQDFLKLRRLGLGSDQDFAEGETDVLLHADRLVGVRKAWQFTHKQKLSTKRKLK
jgi:hypothetical protein